MTAAWPIRDLADALDAEQGRDVLVQVDDVLHSVPIAFLRHAGSFLMQKTRSMHAVLSIPLLEWLQEVDQACFQSTLEEPDRVLSLFGIGPGDVDAETGMRILRQRHRRLVQTLPGSELYGATDDSQATYACLAQGLREQKAFRVVSVYGHGNNATAGIELGDGIWDGSSLRKRDGDMWRQHVACGLEGIELLMQVSCSIGRVNQSGLQDVEGFCVELAVHRARSVIAGLWPLHSHQAAAFAAIVAEKYLRLRRQARSDAEAWFDQELRNDPRHADPEFRASVIGRLLSLAGLRSEALALARKQCLLERPPSTGPHIGLNTIAAFELYGLGSSQLRWQAN